MSKVVGGRLITYTGNGGTLQPPHVVGGHPSHEPSPARPPVIDPEIRNIHLPPPMEVFTVTGASGTPPHLASLGQAFSFAQSNFPAGDGAVTIARKHLFSG